MMTKIAVVLFSSILFLSCTNQEPGPDVSNIKVDLILRRFDSEFFSLDTNNVKTELYRLQKAYPDFLPLYINHVLGLGPLQDSNQLAFTGTKKFLTLNKRIYDTAKTVPGSLDDFKKQMTEGFRYLKYDYPQYKIPEIIATIGPMDALAPMSNQTLTTNYMGVNFIAVSLQFYLGKDFAIYNDPGYASSVAPQYRSKRFSKEYMTADVFSLVIDDMYPDSSNRLPLIERFVEKGKRLQLLSNFLPGMNDTLLTGYTGAQTKWCTENERSIFNFFTTNNLLYERDPALTQPFTSEGPFTQSMGEQSPGNIGAFVGWQIVKAYLKKKGNIRPDELMKTPAKIIFEASSYKPR